MPMVELAEKKESENYVKKLVASITHDLRTPLNGIMGIVDSLREFVGAKGKHFLQIITYTGSNDVLDLAQIEANKLSLNKRERAEGKGEDEVDSAWIVLNLLHQA